ncbi:MAG: hypothetical protein NTU97_04885 [Candidatus Magasanikbacteria bacterium]|nr:hypothetical protein [Candidatus Magasanikbacteria bacterium]
MFDGNGGKPTRKKGDPRTWIPSGVPEPSGPRSRKGELQALRSENESLREKNSSLFARLERALARINILEANVRRVGGVVPSAQGITLAQAGLLNDMGGVPENDGA